VIVSGTSWPCSSRAKGSRYRRRSALSNTESLLKSRGRVGATGSGQAYRKRAERPSSEPPQQHFDKPIGLSATADTREEVFYDGWTVDIFDAVYHE
jgi:hypothetical protein